jgi:transcription initiation factor TFIIB
VYDGDDWASDITEDVLIDSSEDPQSNQDQDWPASITIQDASEKQLVELLDIVVNIGSVVQVTEDVQLRAGEIVVDAWRSNLTMGRTFDAIAAGAVYAASRKVGRARPSSAVASAASIDAKQLQNAYRVLTHELSINIEPPKPGDYLHYLTDQVGLPSKAESVVHDALSDHQSIGGNPAGIAAASLYLYATEDQSSGTGLTLR